MKKIIAIYLLLLNFITFAWSTYLDMDNRSSEVLWFGYNGTQGNAYGPCGKNDDAKGNTGTACTLQPGGRAVLYFTESHGNSYGTIAVSALLNKNSEKSNFFNLFIFLFIVIFIIRFNFL